MRKNGDETMTANPDQWVMDDFEDWIDHGLPISTVAYTVSLAGNITTTLPGIGPVSATKKAEDTWMSWQHGKQDPTLYPILENELVISGYSGLWVTSIVVSSTNIMFTSHSWCV